MVEKKEAVKTAVKKQVGKKKLKSAFFEIKGETVSRKNKSCPKCGPGVFMASHTNRLACGKCGYTEWKER